LLDNQDINTLNQSLPASSQQLTYAKQVLMTALDTSAEQEIQALIQGLRGQAIAPGPSGAPTRGRLDTLPT
ncbi:MAG TPA: hypothetical protein DE179_04595, partial [Oceanospirillaceae bacterium]|nr:hypothetical protein [Oceanospirillaceae bacterium]